MELRFHSGGCCGFKSICNIGQTPTGLLQSPPEDECEYAGDPNYDGDMTWCSAEILFAPKSDFDNEKKNLDGLDEIIQYLNDNRPGSVAQIVTVDRPSYWDQSSWGPELESRGFKKIDEFVNGNSGNNCQIWHLHVRPGESNDDEEDEYCPDEID